MTKLLFLIASLLVTSHLIAQQREFEGKLQYRTKVEPRKTNLNATMLKRLLLVDDTVTIYVKQGNYLRLTSASQEYTIPKDAKVYIRFKGIDTLYYRDFADDTSTVTASYKGSSSSKIAGYDCSEFTIATFSDTTQFRYAPQLYANPAHSEKLLLGKQNLLGQQTKAIWLEGKQRTENYILTNTCFNVSEQTIGDDLFALPELPQAKFNYRSIFKAAMYAGNASWQNYIHKNLKTDLLLKYMKIKKGQSSAEQTAQVAFDVLKTGEVSNVRVLNIKEIHAALAEEAIRLVQNSNWRPATILNESMDFTLTQPIVFRIESE